MTREEAINILIAVAVCSTEYLYCDEHCPFYHPEGVRVCNEWNDEMAKEAVETISALRAQREAANNAPLTLDELRDMPCEPVYIVVGCASWWDIVSYAGMEYLYLKVEGSLPFRDYGKNWTAYRHKPEEGDHDERKENENV